MKSFSFFEIDKDFTQDVLEKMNEAEFNNRSVIVEVTSKPKGRSNKRSSKGFGRSKTSSKRNDSGGQRSDSGRQKSESGGHRSDDLRPNRKKPVAGARRRRR